MQKFKFTIHDDAGIHARPAGLLVKEAEKFLSDIEIEVEGKAEKNGKKANAKRLFALMGLCAAKGDTVKVVVSGEDEEAAAENIKRFLEENL